MFAFLLKNIIIWIFLWTIPWLLFYWFLNKHHINYIHHFWITSCFFLGIAILIFLLFQNNFKPFIVNFINFPFYLLIVFYILAFSIYFLSGKFFTRSIAYWKGQSTTFAFAMLMDYRYLIAKSFEILFQQISIILLISFLLEAKLNLLQLIVIFIAIFGMSHIPAALVKKNNIRWYVLFTLASFLSGIIFPLLIIKIHYGFVYSYIMHWSFYIIAGVLINMRKNKNLAKNNYIDIPL